MFRILLVGLAGFLAIACAAVLLLATPIGRSVLAYVIEEAASSDVQTVTIDGLRGWPPFSFGVDTVTVSDASGPLIAVEELDAQFDPLKSLRGYIALPSLRVERVHVDRLPDGGGDDAGEAFVPPISIDVIEVAELSLADAVFGQTVLLTLSGNAAARAADDISVELSARRIDGRTGVFNVIGRYAGDPYATELDLRAQEQADGLLLSAMGREAGPDYRLTVSTEPKDNALDGFVDLVSSQDAGFKGQFEIAETSAATRVGIAGQGRVEGLLPRDLAAILSGNIDLVVDAEWRAQTDTSVPQLTIRQGSVKTETLDAQVRGEISGGDVNMVLSVNLENPEAQSDPLPIPGGEGTLQSLAINGRLLPHNGQVRLDLTGHVQGLAVAGFTIPGLGMSLAAEAQSPDDLLEQALPYAVRIEADAIQRNENSLQSLPDNPILFVADGRVTPANANGTLAGSLSFPGGRMDVQAGLEEGDAPGSIDLAFSDLLPVTALFGQPILGTLDASATGKLFGAQGTSLALSGEANNLSTGVLQVDQMVGPTLDLSSDLKVSPSGAFSLSDLRLDGGALTAVGDATFANGEVDLAFMTEVADIQPLLPAASGKAILEFTAAGALPNPAFDLSLDVPEADIFGQPLTAFNGDITGEPLSDGSAPSLTAQASLNGTYAGLALDGNANAHLSAQADDFSISDIVVSVGSNQVTGQLQSSGNGFFTGSFSAVLSRIDDISAKLGAPMRGEASASLTFMPEDDQQTVAFKVRSDGVQAEDIRFGKVSVDGEVLNAWSEPTVNGKAKVERLKASGVFIDRLDASATAEDGRTSVFLNAIGERLDLNAAGAFWRDGTVPVIDVTSIQGNAFNVPIELDDTVTVRLEDGGRGAISAELTIGGGAVSIQKAAGEALNVQARATSLPADLINTFQPNLEARGTINADATVTGTNSEPIVEWEADWRDLSLEMLRQNGLPALSLGARGRATASSTTLDANVKGQGISLDMAGTVPFGSDGLALSVTGDVPLALAAARSEREIRVSGIASLDLNVTGGTNSPSINGAVIVNGASFVDGETGFGVRDVNGRIDLLDRLARIQSLRGELGQGGDLTVSGELGLEGAFDADLAIRLVAGRYNDGQTVNTEFESALTVTGPLLGNGLIAGTVNLGRTEIRLPHQLGSAATAIDVTHRNAPTDFSPPERPTQNTSARAAPPSVLRLNVLVSNPGTIFVRGFGVDAAFGGSLNVGGTVSNPAAVGSFDMERGRIEVIGRRFDLTEGTLTFSGDIIPFVRFAATTPMTDGSLVVLVAGLATEPSISFSSTPDLPEEELLSRLLFDREVSNLSALQAAQLVDAAAQLSGVTGGEGLFSQVRNAVRLDDLDIRTNSDGDTTVGLGARINDNVRLGVETGANGRDGRVTIDLGITENLKARGEAGASGSGKFGLSYEREY